MPWLTASRLLPPLLVLNAVCALGCSNLLGLDEERALRPGDGGTSGGSGGTAGASGSAGAAGTLDDYATRVLADQPLAYFRMEEASGSLKNQIDGPVPDGTPTGALSYRVEGAVDSALGFDGATARVELGDVLDFTGSAPMSIEAWVYITRKANFRHIFHKGAGTDSNTEGYSLSVNGSEQLRFSRVTGGNFRNLSMLLPSTAYDRFLHVVVTFDGTTSILYVDGNKEDENPGAGDVALEDLEVPLVFGGYSSGSAGDFAGRMDEVAFYGKVLPEQAVIDHYKLRKQ